jgi:cystathionine beta-lyase
MKEYDFDKLISRENSDCVKYDVRQEIFGKPDVLPMWVADMDFETPDFIRQAVIKRAEHPVYGYSIMPDDYFDAIMQWVKTRHRWDIQKEWISFTPGIVPAINFAVLSYTLEGDGVIVQPPVYFPFFEAIDANHRKQFNNQLIYEDGSYHIDFNDLEEKARTAKLLLLSHPHNPVSRCWTQEELKTLGDICRRHQVIIVSDEIHNDLILPGHTHYPLASLSDEIADITVTCLAPSKTFNIAGLATSSVIISNEELRKKFQKTLHQLHIFRGNFFGYVASTAGYRSGGPWVDQLMQYIQGNFNYLSAFLQQELPHIRLTPPEATFLAWLDFRETGLTDKQIKDKLIFEAGLGLSHGPVFGPGGEGFQRMNLAAPRSVIEEACHRLKQTFNQ